MQAHESKSLGKYRLVASLGQGGMAKVYLALMAGPAGFNKLLVVKILRNDLMAGSTEGVQMFWQEARLAARLQHPNIVQTHEVGEFDGRYFIAMEYLDGVPYGALLQRAQKAPVALAEQLRVVSCVARALHYLHTLEAYNGEPLAIIHRDVSPHNIFVTYEGEVKLLDFGIATTQDPEHFTRVGLVKGKIDYIAPEQLRAEAVDGRVDVFSLGAVLWEAVTRHRFAGGRKVPDAIKIQTRLTGGERRVRELVPDVDPELERIIERAVALDPAARFASAAEFASAIDAYLTSLGERPSPLSLAQILTPMFAEERAQTRALIDEQLQETKRAGTPSEGADWTRSLPHIKRDSAEESSSLGGPHSHYSLTGASPSEVARPQAVRPSTVAAPRPNRGVRIAATLAVAVIASVALALALSRSGEEKPVPIASTVQLAAEQGAKPGATQAIQPSLQEAEVATRPESTLAANTAVLEVEVSPAAATVTIDGVAVKTPFSGDFRKDSALHLVEASAEGFRSSRQFVKLERDQKLVIALSRLTPSASRRAAASEPRLAAPAPASPPAAAVAPAAAPAAKVAPGADIDPGPRSGRNDLVDQVNPYRRSR